MEYGRTNDKTIKLKLSVQTIPKLVKKQNYDSNF